METFHRRREPRTAETIHARRDDPIRVKADHHIAWIDASGTIIEAADTDVGIVANGQFDPKAPGTWTHLVRLPL